MTIRNSNRTVERLEITHSARRSGSDSLRLGERVSYLRDLLEGRADVRAAGQLRADVREARGHVKGWDASGVSPGTADRYQGAVRTMRSGSTLPESAACKASYEFRRASLIHVTRAELKQNLRTLDP